MELCVVAYPILVGKNFDAVDGGSSIVNLVE